LEDCLLAKWFPLLALYQLIEILNLHFWKNVSHGISTQLSCPLLTFLMYSFFSIEFELNLEYVFDLKEAGMHSATKFKALEDFFRDV